MSDAQGERPDPKARFSSRVEVYVRHRPAYPEAVLDVLRTEIGLRPAHVVADIGSGTGISTELFLRHGHVVHAVEPNAAMRAAAERLLGSYAGFHSVAGSAEATTLPAASVDVVVAAQAFHWFDPPAARREFARIARGGAHVVLLWNTRVASGSPFLEGYEALLQEYGTDYREVSHSRREPARWLELLGEGAFRRVLPHGQTLDREGFRGRLLSSSYVPGPDHPRHAALVQAAERLFATHQVEGSVRLVYETEIYVAPIATG